MSRIVSGLSVAAISIATFTATNASAQSDPCNGIELTAIGECHFEFEGGCKANCEPLSMTVACDGECNASIDASCDADCSGTCDVDCEASPGSFSCEGSCEADCSVRAEGQCNSGDSECTAYAEADCSAQCEAECEAVPPMASCEAECNACCTASCDVDANFDCSLSCSAELTGGCEVHCDRPEGALFCDGKFINATDVPACVQYLINNFEISLEFEASASVESSCAMGDSRTAGGGFAFFLAGLGFVFWRRRQGATIS